MSDPILTETGTHVTATFHPQGVVVEIMGAGRVSRVILNPKAARELAEQLDFAARPKPKPWEKAQPNEIWVLTSYGDSAVFRCGSVGLYALGSGTPLDQMLIKNAITEAKRIWPEED